MLLSTVPAQGRGVGNFVPPHSAGKGRGPHSAAIEMGGTKGKFCAVRDPRLRLRIAAATMERTQADNLAEALAAWLYEHDPSP